MKIEFSLLEDLVDFLELALEYIDENVEEQSDQAMGFDRDWANGALSSAKDILMQERHKHSSDFVKSRKEFYDLRRSKK